MSNRSNEFHRHRAKKKWTCRSIAFMVKTNKQMRKKKTGWLYYFNHIHNLSKCLRIFKIGHVSWVHWYGSSFAWNVLKLNTNRLNASIFHRIAFYQKHSICLLAHSLIKHQPYSIWYWLIQIGACFIQWKFFEFMSEKKKSFSLNYFERLMSAIHVY